MTAADNWYRSDIRKADLKRLMKRDDRAALRHFGGYLGLLVGLGAITWGLWGSYWSLPFYLLYCAVWAFATSVVHEACHGTPFRTRWMNETVLFVSGWMMQMEPVAARWGHAGHHTYTHFDKGDSELVLPNPMGRMEFLRQASGVGALHRYYQEIIWLSVGQQVSRIKGVIPEQEMPQATRNARWMLVGYGVVIALSLILQSWVPVVMLLLPRLVGGPAVGLFRVTQHAGMAMNVQDHRFTTRTFYTNRLFQFLYFNMNYHVEHHMFPLVPFYHLPALHELIKDQLPAPVDGLDRVLAEIIYAVSRQTTEPGFHLPREVPVATTPST